MDELGGFEPTDTSGFIKIESIRIKKYAHTLDYSDGMLLINRVISGGRRRTSARVKQG